MIYNTEINGYKLYLKSKGINYFQKRIEDYNDKNYGLCLALECTDDQLSNGDIEFMTLNGLTISKDRKRNYEKLYSKEKTYA